MKVDPRHVGVGMYQHDLTEARLRKSAESVLEECVSFVGEEEEEGGGGIATSTHLVT